MASRYSLTVPLTLDKVGPVVLSAPGRAQTEFGTDAPVLDAHGRQLWRAECTSFVGHPISSVVTSTPLAEIAPGTILVPTGEVSLDFRAEGKAGFNGGAPRGVLTMQLTAESLKPFGDVAAFVQQAMAAQTREGSK